MKIISKIAKAEQVRFRAGKYRRSKIIFIKVIIIASALIIAPLTVYGQTKTSTPSPSLVSPTNAKEDKEIQTLKEKIATKVAELREKNNKVVSGTVQEINLSKGLLKIKNWKDEDYDVNVDTDLTKYYQISGELKKEIRLTDFKKGSYIIVTGIIKENKIDANFIYIDELFLIGSGKVTEVNKEDFYISVITSDKENYTLDIETFTKQQMLNIKLLILENVGFSKIKEGDAIHFVVKKSGKEKELNRFAAQKILIIPQEYFIK